MRAAYGQGSVKSKLLVAVLATTGCALLITGAAVAYYDIRSFRETSLADLTAIGDLLGLASTPALEFDDPQTAAEYRAVLSQADSDGGGHLRTEWGAVREIRYQ